jgi:hypothetical protein
VDDVYCGSIAASKTIWIYCEGIIMDREQADKLFIIHYDSTPMFVTTNKKKAEDALKRYQKDWPILGYRMTIGITAFGQWCYGRGIENSFY